MISARKFKVGDFVWFGNSLIFVSSKNYGIKIGYVSMPPGNPELFWRNAKKVEYQSIQDDLEYSWGWKPLKPAMINVDLKEIPEKLSRTMIESIFYLSGKEP